MADVYITTRQIAQALGMSRKSVIEKARREGWVCREISGGMSFPELRLPPPVRIAVCAARAGLAKSSPDDAVRPATAYALVSDAERQRAVYKTRLIMEAQRARGLGMNLEAFVAAYNSGTMLPAVLARLGSVSYKTLYAWIADYKKNGIDGVVRKYGLRQSGAGASLSVIERYYLEEFYLQTSLPTIAYAFTLMKYNIPASPCSYSTARRYLRSLPKALIDYKRLGVTRFNALHQPYVKQDVRKYAAMQRVVSDHHCLDWVIKYRGKLIRPWITVFQDFRSGKILGWCPSVAPSSFSILAAYYMMVVRYGVPEECLFDNGQDYRSKLINGFTERVTVYTPEGLTEEQTVYIEGALAMIGSRIRFTSVYSGQSKGRTERVFQLLADYLSKPSGAYIGRDTTSRPEEVQLYYRSINKKAQRTEFPDYEWFVSAASAIINYINDVMPSQGSGMDGKTRSVVFEETKPESVRAVDPETVALALTRAEKRRVTRCGVRIGGRDYQSSELLRYDGSDIIVRQKLNGADTVICCDLAGRLICEACAEYTAESRSFDETMGRIKKVRQFNLKQLAEMGTREVLPAPEYKTMIDVAQRMYAQNDFEDFSDPLELPVAVGAEPPAPPAPPCVAPRLKNLFDATEEDYL